MALAKIPVAVYRCDHCNRVVAEVRDAKLVLTIRHDKEQHETTIDLSATKSYNQ
jgi:hypothetical protein